MKKIVILSEESVFSGLIKCGTAEVVDSLANSLTDQYEVNVVCVQGKVALGRTVSDFEKFDKGAWKAKFLKVNYYLIEKNFWPEKALKVIEYLKPDILHNFSEPELVVDLKFRPNKMIYTFDNTAFLLGKENFLSYYDSITTFSVGYTREVAKENGAVSEKLKTLNFKEVSIGVLEEIFSPKKGLLLSAPYNSEDQSGKEKCSRRLREKYNIPDEHFICLTMCRLVEQKGIKYIIQAIPVLKELNAILLIVGKGDKEYEDELSKYTIEDNVIYIKDLGLPIQAAPMAAGADFYLQPSIYESGGIMPMTMSLYGAIPMVTQVGGFSDNFDEYNAIIIKDSNVINGLKEAATLYKNPEKLREKRRVCMTQNFSWDSRKQDFIKLYESV